MKKNSWIVPITFVCIIMGVFLTLQFRTQAAASNPIEHRNGNLIGIIKSLEKEITRIEDDISQYRQKLEVKGNSGQGSLEELQNSLKQAQIQAGLLPVKGPGIIVILDDNKDGLAAAPKDDPNKYIIHYENILNLVSELKVAGAEAISINNQRLVTTSEIRCVGNVILVNTTRLAPPFEIKAIGNPDSLEKLVTAGEYDLLKATGFPVSYRKVEQVSIPEYKGSYKFNFAQPVPVKEAD